MSRSVHGLYGLLFKIWRKKRHDLFLQRVKPAADEAMLDVGGLPAFWDRYEQPVERIDTLNLHDVEWNESKHPHHSIRRLVGDGRALEMPDKSYEIVFSNSVIEHVGTWQDQVAFASELRRVGQALWVQTPAFECPIEPHYLAPFVHYVPRRLRGFVIRWLTPRGLLERPSREEVADSVKMTRLLSKREMKKLFPDCEVITERILWIFPKAYVAVRDREADFSRARIALPQGSQARRASEIPAHACMPRSGESAPVRQPVL